MSKDQNTCLGCKKPIPDIKIWCGKECLRLFQDSQNKTCMACGEVIEIAHSSGSCSKECTDRLVHDLEQDAMIAAQQKYGGHEPHCNILYIASDEPCDCGLAAQQHKG